MSTADITDSLERLTRHTHKLTRLVTEQLVLKAAALVVLYLAVTPFIFVIWTSFWTGRIGSLDGAFTLQNYVQMYSSAEVYLLFINTLTITLGMFAIAMTGGVAMSWLIGRTNIPTKGYLELVILAPYAIPSFIYALMFIFAFSPQAGLVNHYWMELGFETSLFNIYTVWGILFVMGIDAVTTVYLITIPSLTNLDPNLEESSRIHGANMLETIRRISLPVVVPSLASAGVIVLIRGIGTFASVAVIGVRFGFDVFATRIWEVTSQQYPPNYGYATALSVTLILVTGFLILTYRRITKRKEDYMVVTGEGYRPSTWDLGKWKWPITVGVWCVMVFVWIIPILIVFIASFHTLWAGEIELSKVTLRHYATVLSSDSRFWKGMSNTLVISFWAAIFGTTLVTLAAYYTERTQYRLRGVVDFFLIAPMAFPGIILGTSVLITYLFFNNLFGISILGTIWIIVIGVTTNDLPTTSRIAIGNIVQIHKELEEMARISGANWLEQMRSVFMPLYKGTLGILLFYWFIGATKTLTIPLMLYVGSTEPISVYLFGAWYFQANFEAVAVISVIFMGLMGVILASLKIFNIKFYELV